MSAAGIFIGLGKPGLAAATAKDVSSRPKSAGGIAGQLVWRILGSVFK
jgi:hypothetical protein